MLDDGRRLDLILKDVNRSSLAPDARAAKPSSVYDPRREIEVYRSILGGADVGTARCHATVADERAGHYWLCMESVPGVELYQVGELSTWQTVATWLARFHAHFARDTRWRAAKGRRHLLSIDRPLMQTWFDRARTFAAERGDAAVTEGLWELDACWDTVVNTLVSWPQTFLHGELYASNVIVDDGHSPRRVCPIDWEMAAVGPDVVDLAALTSGVWSRDEPGRIVEAYVEEARAQRPADWTRSGFDRAFACARIYLAVQWLRWARDWTPPSEHDYDWAAELARVTESLST